jgi:hypothetical protein
MNNSLNISPGRRVEYWDEDGELHAAVVIDVFDRPTGYGPYVNLLYNPDQRQFGGNTEKDLECETSVDHRIDSSTKERSYTTESVYRETENE